MNVPQMKQGKDVATAVSHLVAVVKLIKLLSHLVLYNITA